MIEMIMLIVRLIVLFSMAINLGDAQKHADKGEIADAIVRVGWMIFYASLLVVASL